MNEENVSNQRLQCESFLKEDDGTQEANRRRPRR